MRWSLLEWVLAGSLPRKGRAGGSAPGSVASRVAGSARAPAHTVDSGDTGESRDVEARLEQATLRVQAERARREEEAAARRRQSEAERAGQHAGQARAALAAEEAALRGREGSLHRELREAPQGTATPATPASLAERLRQGVAKTRERLVGGLGRIVLGRKALDGDALEELEELLLTADMGPQTATRLIKALEAKLRRKELSDPQRLQAALQAEVQAVMGRVYDPPVSPGRDGVRTAVILFAGVNGTGKTTTIGKLGAQYRAQGLRVLLVAGDTFRAAAAEQLAGWAERAGCDLFRQHEGANPSGVIYQAVEKAVKDGYDVVLCDTAGRLHTKSNLMEELKKIKRVIGKIVPEAPHETYLVLDANNGQNAIHQAREFHEAIGLSGLIVTKLDGTARGGVIVGIVNEFDLPVRYIGVGEGVADLRPFDAHAFTQSLFD